MNWLRIYIKKYAGNSRFILLQSPSSTQAASKLKLHTAQLDLESFLKPEVRTVLVKGEPGTGKTLLGLELLRRYGRGVYLSSRVSQEGILDQYPDLKKLFRQGKIKVRGPKARAKFHDMRFADAVTMVDSVLESFGNMKEPLVILDSWDTIAKELDKVERMKTEKTLVAMADGRRARLVFISEEPVSTSTDYAINIT